MSEVVWKPDVTVAAVVEREGRFLFVEERVRGALVLNQPAGHLEADESLVAATIRETLEETAWEIEPTGLVGVYQWTSPDGLGFLRVALAARALREHAGQALDQGIERAVWLSPEALDAHPVPGRSPLVRRCVHDFLTQGCVPLSRLNLIGPDGLRIA
jgi:8-oxo-dGTP pyrophosphatase MutT (NUDIX family)